MFVHFPDIGLCAKNQPKSTTNLKTLTQHGAKIETKARKHRLKQLTTKINETNIDQLSQKASNLVPDWGPIWIQNRYKNRLKKCVKKSYAAWFGAEGGGP